VSPTIFLNMFKGFAGKHFPFPISQYVNIPQLPQRIWGKSGEMPERCSPAVRLSAFGGGRQTNPAPSLLIKGTTAKLAQLILDHGHFEFEGFRCG